MERGGSCDRDVVIVGAGVSGLSCARELTRLGRAPVVLERSRGVGGRCATRRRASQPIDHGVAFYHGDDDRFLAAVREADGESILDGWPRTVHGTGRPCQPRAFRDGERRFAFERGVNVFPKYLARDLDIRRETSVTGIRLLDEVIEIETSGGRRWKTSTVLLASAAAQAGRLFAPLSGMDRRLDSAMAVVAMAGSVPCLTVLAGYDAGVPEPEWDLWYPEDSRVLQLMSHDSSKRTIPRQVVLVFQALPAWSRSRLGESAQSWTQEILEEAGRLVGDWAESPSWAQAHAWRFARADHGSEFTDPISVDLGNGRHIGIAGECFAPGGGVQAAWSSGKKLARRLCGEPISTPPK